MTVVTLVTARSSVTASTVGGLPGGPRPEPAARVQRRLACLALAAALLIGTGGGCGRADPDGEAGARAALQRAIALAQQGDSAAALAEVTAASERDPELAEAHVLRGALLERAGRTDEAASAYRAALALEPDGEARLHLARIAQLRRLDDALEAARAALRERPDDVEAQRLFAERLLARGRDTAANAYFARALRAAPYDARLHAGLGRALTRLHRQARALHHLDLALHLDPTLQAARSARIWVLATSADATLRDPERALEIARESAAAAGAAAPGRLEAVAAAQAAVGDFDAARATIARALAAAQRDGDHVAAARMHHLGALFAADEPFVEGPAG